MHFPCAFIQSAIGLLFIVCGEFLEVQSKSIEMCQHVTGSGRCPAILADINGFLFLLSPSHPNPSLHLSIHASIFCSSPFFLSISSYVSPSWVPRPFVWPCLTFPSFNHSHIRTSLYLLSHTLIGHHRCRVRRQTAHVLDMTASERLFPFCTETNLWVATALKIETNALADLASQKGCSYAVDDSRNSMYTPGWGIVLMCKSDAVIDSLAVMDRILVMIWGNVCVCYWKSECFALLH